MKSTVVLTERLELREITEADTDLIVFWRSNPNIYRYFGYPQAITRDEHLKWYKKYIRDESIKHFIAMEIKTEQNVGVFGVKRYSDNLQYAEISSCILDEEARGNGFAQEATNALIEYAVRTWNIKKMVAIVHEENEASKKMFERCGFYLKDSAGLFHKYERDICYT